MFCTINFNVRLIALASSLIVQISCVNFLLKGHYKQILEIHLTIFFLFAIFHLLQVFNFLFHFFHKLLIASWYHLLLNMQEQLIRTFSLFLTNDGQIAEILEAELSVDLNSMHSTFNQSVAYTEILALLWQQKELKEVASPDLILLSALLAYRDGLIIYEEIISLVKLFYSQGLLNGYNAPYVLSVLISPDLSLSEWLNEQKRLHYEFAIGFPFLPTLLDAYQNLTGTSSENLPNMPLSLVSTIYKREKTFFEHIDEYSTPVLLQLLDWVPASVASQITEELIHRELHNSTPNNWEEVDQTFMQSDFLNNFPPSFTVLTEEKVKNLPKVPFDGQLMEKLPEQYAMAWLPKYVFSRPDVEEKVSIHFPGGSHIGHSSILVKTRHGMILLDYGMTVLNNRMPKWLPLLQKVDVVLLSHAHLDHSGALPVLIGSNPKLPVFATRETKKLTEILWNDTANVLNSTWHQDIIANDPIIKNLVSQTNIVNAVQQISEIDIGETFSVLPNVEVTPYHASHLFGSVGFELNIKGKRILYTGDFNADGTQIFPNAKFPLDLHTIIFDGTYYGREVDQVDNTKLFKSIFNSSNRVLIPAFSVGRTQEVLYHLLTSGVANGWKIMVAGMGVKVMQNLSFTVGEDFGSRVTMVPSVDADEFVEKTIVISGNGMLQAGTARRLLDATADDSETSVVFTGYLAPNTLGYNLLNSHPLLAHQYSQQFYKASFSGHTSGQTLKNLLQDSKGEKIIVHSPRDIHTRQTKDIVFPGKSPIIEL